MKQFFDKKKTENGVILAVSGGVDSMTLLYLALREIPDKIKVVTVNHHLRKSAEKDVLLVTNFCKANFVPYIVADVYPKPFAKENGLSIETAARILRHNVLVMLSDDKPVCLAHNKNDQAETVLMHLTRGSGNKGVSGMSEQGKFYRPLLNLTRCEIEKIAKNNNIPFAVDKTNKDNRYSRNFVRNKILPKLNILNPNAVSNIARFADLSQIDEDYFDKIVNEIYPTLNISVHNGQAQIGNDVFELHPSLKNRVLIKIFHELGYNSDIEQIHLEDLDKLNKNNSGKKLCLPFDLVAVKSYNVINIFSSQNLQKNNTEEYPFQIGITQLKDTKIEISDQPNDGLYFDVDKIPADAVIRFRKEGDVFCKYGGGTKKLKEYFIDKKIPNTLRDKIPLIATGNEILFIAGVEISDKIKVTNGTKNICYAKIIE